MAQVFISHSTKDDKFIDKLVGDLNQNGISTFVDHQNIKMSDNWAAVLSNALDECEKMIVVLSPDSASSKMCLKEWVYFNDRGELEIIPIKYRPIEKTPFLLNNLQWVNMEAPDSYEENISKLIEFISDDVIQRPTNDATIKAKEEVTPELKDQLPAQLYLRYPIVRCAETPKYVGIATGNIAEIKGVDVLVNSENNRLRMARPEEASVSAALNAFSMIYDEFHNTEECPVEDALNDYRKKAGIAHFPPTTVIETTSGNLRGNNVRHILHAVSVRSGGRRQRSFIPFSKILLARCVKNALRKVDELNASLYADDDTVPLTRIVFPILGTGDAGGDIHVITPRLIESVIEYMELNDTLIKEVYFVAYLQKHLVELESIFNDYADDYQNNNDLDNPERVNTIK